jgi:hypothetical protein|tara:strand:+ start:201 stop:902 length:702 start_codon:yes stop_codon:yes gene_type:complete
MGLFGTSNGQLASTISNNQQSQFKTMNNLLTLQENHVEDFFQYHGEAFLSALEQLMEDVTQRVVGQMLSKLEFTTTSAGIILNTNIKTEYEQITAANIELDLQGLLASAINTEVVMQRRMAKAQYLESQGFGGQAASTQQQMGGMGVPNQMGMNPANIQGSNMGVGMNNTMNQQMMAMNNTSGYPVPPAGYDNMNNAYWIDPATGQMTYTPPASGLGLGAALTKGVAWAKWLA